MSFYYRKYISPALKIHAVFILAFLLHGCSTHTRPPLTERHKTALDILIEKTNYLIADPQLFNAQIGVTIESVDEGETLFALNEHKLFISASNMKLFTTAAALLNFGPTFHFKTAVYARGKIEKGVLEGDLIIKGSGDPSLAARFSGGDSRSFFRAWADSLQAQGITQINGNIVGDASYFQSSALGYGWQWDDEPFWYSAQISALSFNDNCVDVAVIALGHGGDAADDRRSAAEWGQHCQDAPYHVWMQALAR